MKKLLALALVALMAGGAMAQDYNYEQCQNQLAIFNDTVLPGIPGEFPEEFSALADLPLASGMVPIHVFAIKATQPILGYDAFFTLPASLVGLSHAASPGNNWVNIGDAVNVLSGFAAPILPDANGSVYLSVMTVFVAANAPGDIFAGPSNPSGIGGDGPTFNMGGEYMRMNFIDLPFDGCDEPAPAEGRIAVANGGSSPIVVRGIIATETMTLSGVKALFQ